MRVGIEVGGTFTDLVAVDGNQIRVAKVPSVPSRPDEGVFAALAAAGIPLAAIDDLVHGSTVATNAVLERKGALTALVATRGFGDVLLIQRQDRQKVYDLHYRKPEPVVARRDVLELDERMLSDGTVSTPLDANAAEAALAAFLAARPYQAVAVCLLNAYANPSHEKVVAEVIRRRFPGMHVSCSFEISREFREYERASTTALSAYVQPIIDRYLGRFEARLTREGFTGRFSVMQSNGGRLPADAIRRNSITALFSGPAAGVTGAVRQAGASGYRNLITFDMGGTSTDVCLVADGRAVVAPMTFVDGLPVRTPVIDIASVGAGGGSIVRRDAGGMLHAGPRSSGADPGPACYGRGGRDPTITDAHVVRGTLPADSFLGGKMKLDVEAARRSFGPLAEAFGVEIEQMADDAIRIADANVVRAIQLISTELGRDPRDYVLVPYGGAGPLHAARIAEELGIATIVVPRNAGVLSALGLVAADFTHYETLTRRIRVDDQCVPVVQEVLSMLLTAADRRFAALGMPGPLQYQGTLQMRFVGQAFELDVAMDVPGLENLSRRELEDAFDRAHEQVYLGGSGRSGRAIEIVGFRLGASFAERFDLPVQVEDDVQRPQREIRVLEMRESRNCLVTVRAHVDARRSLPGPALIEDGTSTVYVPPGWTASSDSSGNLILRSEASQ